MDAKIIQGQGITTNVGDVYSVTLSVGVTAYVDKGIYICQPSATNTTTTPTINVNSIGAKTISRQGVSVKIGDINNDWMILMYSVSANAMYLLNPTSPVKDVLYVTKDGDNGTAIIGRLDRPYLTIAAAQTAASSGQTIMVYPGTYSESGLGKAGINYHFMDGAIVASTTSSMWIDTGAISYNISGDGEFTSTSGRIVYFSNGGTLVMDGRLIGSTTVAGAITASSTSTVFVNMSRYITTTTGYCISLADGSGTVYVKTGLIQATGAGGRVTHSVLSTGKLFLTADEIKSAGTYLFRHSGDSEIRGRMTHTGSAEAVLGVFTAISGTQNYYGDIACTSTTAAISITGNTGGIVSFYGKITGAAIFNSIGNTGTIIFYNDCTANASTSAAFLPYGGTTKILGRVYNSDANAASYAIDLSNLTGTFILQNAVLVTGAGSAPSIYAGSAKNVLVLGTCMANINKHVNITVLAGSFTFDSNVQ